MQIVVLRPETVSSCEVCLKMAVYEVFKQSVYYRYKTTLCSKATIVLAVTSFFTVILPLIISYRSCGFWLKTDYYQEQPDVKFTHDYMLLLETNNPHAPIECRARYSVKNDVQRHCQFKSLEDDVNHDGKVDNIRVVVTLPLLQNETVHSVVLLLSLEFQISSICRLRMQSLLPVQYISALPGSNLVVSGDLRFVQKKPVDYRNAENLFSASIFSEDVSLSELFLAYSQRNYSTKLMNEYSVWTAGHDEMTPFVITLSVNIPESAILYRPGFWQVIKWAWMQYLSILIVFIYFFNILKEYIFSNQLVPTYRNIPWKLN